MSAFGELVAAIVQGLIELTILLAQAAARPFQFVFSRRYRTHVQQRWATDPIRGAVELVGGSVVLAAFLGVAFWWSLLFTSGSKMQSDSDDLGRAQREVRLHSFVEKVKQFKERRE